MTGSQPEGSQQDRSKRGAPKGPASEVVSARKPLPSPQEVRQAVLEQGFDRVGFARAGPAPFADRLSSWLAEGFAGGMDYLARNLERRTDPRRILPGARTVIATALHYPGPRETTSAPRSGGSAVIASYARGVDYHRVMERRLRAASKALSAGYPGHTFRYYVDTGPVLERAWVQEAGIGWIGKNTCAIHSERGSYFFIGTIFTTLEIPPDGVGTNHCGACRLCIDACPTGAIVEPFRLDSRRCISYLTIEHRGPIPEEFHGSLESLVFGCDICQEVCPFNRPDRIGGDSELEPRQENESPELEDLLRLEERKDFGERFPRSAVQRARFGGFLRNVILAAGNSGRRSLLPLLERVARGPLAAEPGVTEALRSSLGRLKSSG